MTKFKTLRIRTQLTLLILITGTICFLLFQFLWMHKWNVWEALENNPNLSLNIFPDLDDDFWLKLRQEALNYNVPESEDDREAAEDIQPFFGLADEYTGIYIYGLEDGTYRAGQMPRIMDSEGFRFTFDTLYHWTNGTGEMNYEFPVEFKNGYAQVVIYFYHRTRFVTPYFGFCLSVSIILFFAVILFFIGRKMKSVILLKQNILQMASGDLTTPVSTLGQDEIGILAHELDSLRLALQNTISQEQESHKANQDLVAALSHDLRTPLTILRGYLEILKLNPQPDLRERYLEQCLHKTDEIKEMTDRIFEYALVYESTEAPDLSLLSAGLLSQYLAEDSDFLRLTGFHVVWKFPEAADAAFLGDRTMLKRIFSNLFSNIIKYGNKKEPVVIAGSIEDNIEIIPQNAVKPDYSNICSTQIGLKSVRKMAELMGGKLRTELAEEQFTVKLQLPIHHSPIQFHP